MTVTFTPPAFIVILLPFVTLPDGALLLFVGEGVFKLVFTFVVIVITLVPGGGLPGDGLLGEGLLGDPFPGEFGDPPAGGKEFEEFWQ